MIALIGSGNVAHWLAQKLRHSSEYPIAQVYSRHLTHARDLASKVGAEAIDSLSSLNPDCEMYIFSLKDDAYPEVLKEMPFKLPLALHTAGSVSQNIFQGYAEKYGVLYPLQTFTKSENLEDLSVPLCVEDNALAELKGRVRRLARELSDQLYDVSEEQRAVLHLAAVFACNFSNALANMAEDILKADNLDFQILLPLMRQTLDKLESLSPTLAQTGPAARKDTAVMEKHLKMLPSEEMKTVYRLLSNYIISKR